MARAGGLRQLGVAGGSFGGAYEARETIDVGEAIGAGLVIGLAGRVAQAGDFVGLEAAGDAHFVEIGVGREGQKAGMLVLPTEAANGGMSGLTNLPFGPRWPTRNSEIWLEPPETGF